MFEDFLKFLAEFGIWGLAIHSFADAIIFPVPAFFTQVSLSMLDPANALWLATAGYAACLLGTPIGYLIGRLLGVSVMNRILRKSWIDAANRLIQRNGEAAVLFGSFTPIPFKVFTILSGCLGFPLWKLMAYAAIGRAVKFYVVGLLFYMYGNAAEGMVKDVSLYIFVCSIPLVAAFILLRRRRRRNMQQQETLQSEAQQEAARQDRTLQGGTNKDEKHKDEMLQDIELQRPASPK